MFRKTFFIVFMFSVWNCGVAQSLSRSEIKSEVQTLTTEYGLNETQEKKVKDLVKKREDDIKKVSKDKSLSKAEKMKKLDAIRSGAYGSILLLLDDDQRNALFEKKMADAKASRMKKSKN